jgi:hypothetical protein
MVLGEIDQFKSQASSGAPEEPREEEGETDVWAKPDRRPVMKAAF